MIDDAPLTLPLQVPRAKPVEPQRTQRAQRTAFASEHDYWRRRIGYRIDLLIDDLVIVEVKARAKLLPVHEAQLLSYLKLSGRPLGLLINFHVIHLKDGITRMVNELDESTGSPLRPLRPLR